MNARWTKLLCVLVGSLLAGSGFGQGAPGIVNSRHNLSTSGRGSLRAATEQDVCIFCHAPHSTSGPSPLWNHAMSTASYTPYSSSTLKATVGQPTGASKLCLSCHDGTVALGLVGNRSQPIVMAGGQTTLPPGSTRLGTDLSGHHPISFTYDAALATQQGELRDPSTLVLEVQLDRNQQLQCTSCHDPHNDQYGKFLVKDNTASALCVTCHAPNDWTTSAHATSPATWNGNGQDPWPHTPQTTVTANACENCHRPHDAGIKPLLLNFPAEEQNCYSCHSGTVAAKDVASEFTKASVHPITLTSGIHDPTEDAINPPRHIECADCHNPHAAKSASATAPNASGALTGVRGVDISGAVVKPLTKEYELCFRCHADSGNRGPARVTRQNVETNTRHEFDPANVSFHPVVTAGKNPSVPSLLPPWSAASLVYCTDCHNNDQGPGAGTANTGPSGPHGSAYLPILERQLLLTDLTPYNQDNFALCFKCHSPSVVVSDQTTSWKHHKKHIEDFRGACTTCHDAHGSTQPHLINFNTTYVQPYNNVLNFTDTGVNSGNCTLSCHDGNGQNKVHDAKSY